MTDFDIQVVGFDGARLRGLTSGGDWDVDAQWSPDGQWLSFTRNPPSPTDCRDSAVWVIRRDGTQARSVVRGCAARWSPDGHTLVYVEQRTTSALKVVQLDGTGARTLLETTDMEQPAGFSPDGKTILLTHLLSSSGGTAEIRTLGIDGSPARNLGPGYAACWSPDGSQILYTERFESALRAMKSDGTDKRLILSTPASEADWR